MTDTTTIAAARARLADAMRDTLLEGSALPTIIPVDDATAVTDVDAARALAMRLLREAGKSNAAARLQAASIDLDGLREIPGSRFISLGWWR